MTSTRNRDRSGTMPTYKATQGREVFIALMGPTGTGKSTFINLLTDDSNIRVGHDLESQTTDVSTSVYLDQTTGLSVTLIDTPGFDDSRSDITDTDILQRIATFLQAEGGRRLSGIIYLHRISDPRVGGAAKKNLRVFREICGDEMLKNVRLVTTNWSSVGQTEGNSREAELANRIFRPLIDAGAQMHRHDQGLASAQFIMSTLVQQAPITLKIQRELNSGKALGDTSAGAIIIEEMKELQKKHEKDMEDLRKEMQEAEMDNDEDLRAELAKDRKQLEQLMARQQENQRRLAVAYVPQALPPPPPPPTQKPLRRKSVANPVNTGRVSMERAANPPDPRTTHLRPPTVGTNAQEAYLHETIGQIIWHAVTTAVTEVVNVVRSSTRM